MSKPTTATVAALAMLAASALPALASQMQTPNPDDAVVGDAQTVRTIDADGREGRITIVAVDRTERDALVLGALARQTTDAYIVQDNSGDLFINHLVPIEELGDPTLRVDTVDTYTFEHEGRVYTNKIVTER